MANGTLTEMLSNPQKCLAGAGGFEPPNAGTKNGREPKFSAGFSVKWPIFEQRKINDLQPFCKTNGAMYLALLLGESEPTASLYRDALGITGKGPLYV